MYGEEGLKGGAGMPEGGAGGAGGPGMSSFFSSMGGGGFRPGNANDIFSQLFGSAFDDDSGMSGFTMHMGPGGISGMSSMGGHGRSHGRAAKPAPKKPEPVTFDLNVTLEELYTGTTKKLKITRKRNGQDSPRVIEINIAPGWKEGTKITFENEGDEDANGLYSDIIFVVKEKQHPVFVRSKNDLLHTRNITLKEALCGVRVVIKGIDGKELVYDTTQTQEIITPGKEKYFWGNGMPSKNGPGNLVVTFNVVFPTSISAETRQYLERIL